MKPEIHRDLSLTAQQQGKSINSFVAGQLAVVVKRSGLRETSPLRDASAEVPTSSNPGTARRLNKQTSKIRVAPQEK